ncbi:MAG: flagellar basal body rod protein FlgC [Candidatus Eisenbacteria bacterium]
MPKGPTFSITPRPVREFLGPLRTAAAGMSVQQRFMEAIATNIANAETTKTPDGGPYRRELVTVERDPKTGAISTRAVPDPREGRLIYDPGHPDANEQGFVSYPNVDVNVELVDLMVARRVHEANASVFQAAKAMLKRALDI